MKQNVLDAKKAVVEEITEKLQNSASTVVVEYRGLTVAEVTELRRQLRAESIDFKVYKNSMVSRAAEAANLEELNETLTGSFSGPLTYTSTKISWYPTALKSGVVITSA